MTRRHVTGCTIDHEKGPCLVDGKRIMLLDEVDPVVAGIIRAILQAEEDNKAEKIDEAMR